MEIITHMKSVINRDFIKCGITGWCIEVLFTSASCFKEKNYKLIGKNSIWMFPIYGMASVIKPISKKHLKLIINQWWKGEQFIQQEYFWWNLCQEAC